jgi:DNA invertase Pin-like site-specific DNA recombinase|tara:strand:+ start:44 stop:685 length:642 start_codon:yes stop_codon:yes gene_type:complete
MRLQGDLMEVKRIGLYIRCSTDKQEVVLQREQLYEYVDFIRRRNRETDYLTQEFVDEGESGGSTKRPQFTRMMEAVQDGRLDYIMVTRLDRLSRSLQDLLNTTTALKNHDCDFVITDQNIDTSTPQGRLLFQIMGAFAEFEREAIRERMQHGRKKAAVGGSKSGKPCNRPKLDVDVDGIAYKFGNGMSMNQIAKEYEVSITLVRSRLQERGLR